VTIDSHVRAMLDGSNINQVDWDLTDQGIRLVCAETGLGLDEVLGVSGVEVGRTPDGPADGNGYRYLVVFLGGFAIVRAKGLMKLRPLLEDIVFFDQINACVATDERTYHGGEAGIQTLQDRTPVLRLGWEWTHHSSDRSQVEAERTRIVDMLRRAMAEYVPAPPRAAS
jgi:hypothetical protein